MKINRFEFGFCRDFVGKITFAPFYEFSKCGNGCKIFSMGPFYFTIMSKKCMSNG